MGGLITIVGITLANISLFRLGSRWLSSGNKLIGFKKILFIGILFVAQAASWMIFDWNQIAPGLGMLPNIAGSAYTLLVLFVIGFCNKVSKDKTDPFPSSWLWVVIIAWLIIIFLIILLISWFQNGVTVNIG